MRDQSIKNYINLPMVFIAISDTFGLKRCCIAWVSILILKPRSLEAITARDARAQFCLVTLCSLKSISRIWASTCGIITLFSLRMNVLEESLSNNFIRHWTPSSLNARTIVRASIPVYPIFSLESMIVTDRLPRSTVIL